jgi:hypothetical protein
LAFVMQHPAVTAPIVPPGVTVARSDQGYQPPSLTNPFLRRRRIA